MSQQPRFSARKLGRPLTRRSAGLVVLLCVGAAIWARASGTVTAVPDASAAVAKEAKATGIARMSLSSLAAAEEAAVLETLRHIDEGTEPRGPLAKKWGAPFKNWSGDLPGPRGDASPFREFRVEPAPGTTGAGTRRIVKNTQSGEVFYTWTHYGDTGEPAFVQLR